MNTVETTLEDFQSRARGHVVGEKTAVTLCYKSLSRADQARARFWMRDRAAALRGKIPAARRRLDVLRVRGLELTAQAYDDLRYRLGEL